MQKLLTFFSKNICSKNICVYAIFDDQTFNHSLTNDIVSFEQLGPGLFIKQVVKINRTPFLLENDLSNDLR